MSVECCRVLGEGGRTLHPSGDVGIKTLPDQLVSKKMEKGFNFNVMVVGEPGLGKSTLMETLFKIEMPVSDISCKEEELEITTKTIVEDNVTMDLKIISTQNYAQALNKNNSMVEAIKYIDNAFDQYLDMEWSSPRRTDTDPDPRVHLCIYMINPSGRSVRSVDLIAMKELAAKVNLIPVIAKSDTVLPNVIEGFKDRITDDLCEYGVLYYEFPMEDEAMVEKNENYQNELPFAVAGSRAFVTVDGRPIRARQYPWGIVEIENDKHTQFNMLRDSVVRSNMAHLIMSTHKQHYEDYRRDKMDEIGYTDNDMQQAPVPLAVNAEKQLAALDAQMSKVSQKSTDSLMKRINQKIDEVRKRETDIDARYQPKIVKVSERFQSLQAEKTELVSMLMGIQAQAEEGSRNNKKDKKKSGVFRQKL